MTRLLILVTLALAAGVSSTLPAPFNYIGVAVSVVAMLGLVLNVCVSGSVTIKRTRDVRDDD